ncbi:MAG: cardiolipin synthase [Muribaculaceae bacterium]|nr:cardiolipin synthase [Muribaculaceae bacterium]
MTLYIWINIALLIIYSVIVISCVVVVVSENKNPIRALSWTLALLFLPIVGVVFYLFFGRSLKGKAMINRKVRRKLLERSRPKQHSFERSRLSADQVRMIRLAQNLCHAPLDSNNSVEIFTDGRSKFDSLKKDIHQAKDFIFIQYYIYSDDRLGNEITELLADKVRQGVRVKVLYDHVGSFSTRNKFFNNMRKLGIDSHPFFRVTFRKLANRINWRNHRKLVIIDGKVGYIGGMNIADRYVEKSPDGRIWRDTHLRVEGPIIESMMYSFAVDWNFLRPDAEVQPLKMMTCDEPGDVDMQLVTSGPVDKWNNLVLCFQQAIASARKRLYIQTPYFLPTDALLKALQGAALSGVDVRIMIPEHTDSILLGYGSRSYIDDCLKAGVKVYMFTPGMLHAKTMIIDDDFVTTGSVNFDFRSFENNFEANLLIYSEEINRKMRDIFFLDLSSCRKLTLSRWRSRPRTSRIIEALVRLFAPIL